VALLQESHGIGGKLGGDENIRLGRFDFLQNGRVIGGPSDTSS